MINTFLFLMNEQLEHNWAKRIALLLRLKVWYTMDEVQTPQCGFSMAKALQNHPNYLLPLNYSPEWTSLVSVSLCMACAQSFPQWWVSWRPPLQPSTLTPSATFPIKSFLNCSKVLVVFLSSGLMPCFTTAILKVGIWSSSSGISRELARIANS